MQNGEALPSYSLQIDTPDGEMFVHIAEDREGTPRLVLINIGKAGTAIAAWGDATARLCTELLPHSGVHKLIEMLSGITASRFKYLAGGAVCRSGPEGLAICLLRYRAQKFKENQVRHKPGRATRD